MKTQANALNHLESKPEKTSKIYGWFRSLAEQARGRIRNLPPEVPRFGANWISYARTGVPYVRQRPHEVPTRAERRGGTTDHAALQRIRGRA